MALEHIAKSYGWLVPLIPALPALAAVLGMIFGGLFLHRRTAALTIGAMAVSTARRLATSPCPCPPTPSAISTTAPRFLCSSTSLGCQQPT